MQYERATRWPSVCDFSFCDSRQAILNIKLLQRHFKIHKPRMTGIKNKNKWNCYTNYVIVPQRTWKQKRYPNQWTNSNCTCSDKYTKKTTLLTNTAWFILPALLNGNLQPTFPYRMERPQKWSIKGNPYPSRILHLNFCFKCNCNKLASTSGYILVVI